MVTEKEIQENKEFILNSWKKATNYNESETTKDLMFVDLDNSRKTKSENSVEKQGLFDKPDSSSYTKFKQKYSNSKSEVLTIWKTKNLI